jgi:Ca-activated chloride channel family protein
MDLALDLVERQRLPGRAARVVLISDGLPNLGDPSPEGLVRRAQRAPRGDYVLTAVGVGEDFNEFLMSSLADAGTGNYHFLANGGNLAKVFANELSTARTTVASGVAVAIAAQPGVRIVDASGYPLEAQKDGSVIFRPGILFAGQQRRIWVTYQVRPDSTGSIPLGAISMSWSRNGSRHSASLSNEPSVTVVKDEKQYYTDFDEESWERSVVTEEWNKTRQDVSRAVSAGKKEKAVGILQEYRARNSAANAYIGSGAVSDNLDDAAALEAEVEETFIGEDQRDKQNVFSKSQSEDAYKSRRVGQLKQ